MFIKFVAILLILMWLVAAAITILSSTSIGSLTIDHEFINHWSLYMCWCAGVIGMCVICILGKKYANYT